jgi:putative ABC transport system ATP-binding protein
MPALRITDLTIEYVQGGYAVRPIDGMTTQAHDGELVILLGPSGSGKTTLLSCLAGLLTPAAGTIHVGETSVTALSGADLADYRRHGVGIVFQAFNLIPSLTARENVAAPLQLAGVGRADANARAEELLARVGLEERMRHRPRELSGGQQQRVAIARALVHDAPLIVADEPTAHLDFVQVEEVLTLIRELAVSGRLVVVATHDGRFRALADRVIDLMPASAAEDIASRRVELEAGEVLFEQGDVSDLVYEVESGTVEIFRRRVDGGEDLLISHGPGAYFGEIGPLLGLPRSASARAREPTRLTGYGREEFRRRRRAGDPAAVESNAEQLS